MKKNIFTLLGYFIYLNSIAQIPNIEWQSSLGGSDYEGASCVIQTVDNNYIVVGNTISNDGDVSLNHGANDIWIVKLNTSGGIVWEKTLGGTDSERACSVLQTSDGGYIVAGTTESNDGDIIYNHRVGYDDFWIIKLNATGTIMWQKSFGGTGHDSLNSITQTSDGGYIVAGSTESNNDDVTGNHGANDIWVVKLNALGESIWQRTLGGTNQDIANNIIQTLDGGYIIAGNTNSNDGDITENHGDLDAWIIKLNSNGEITWQKTFGGTNQDNATSILQTLDGEYIVAGNTASNDGDITENHGDLDVWIIKLNEIGEIVWQKTFGGTNTDFAPYIIKSYDGNFLVSSTTWSNNGDITGTNHGITDYWIIKFDSSGVLIWQKTLGGTDGDQPLSINQTSDNGYIIAGFSASIDGDVRGNNGNGDYWVVKLAPEKNYFSETKFIIYPNPINNYLIIQNVEFSTENFNFKILDFTGRIILAGNSNFNSEINIESLEKGNYILQIEIKNRKNAYKRIIKN